MAVLMAALMAVLRVVLRAVLMVILRVVLRAVLMVIAVVQWGFELRHQARWRSPHQPPLDQDYRSDARGWRPTIDP
jgi:hypothetical protein